MPRVIGGWAFSYGRGTPVNPHLEASLSSGRPPYDKTPDGSDLSQIRQSYLAHIGQSRPDLYCRIWLSLSVYSRCCARICSAMAGVPHRPLIPSLPTTRPWSAIKSPCPGPRFVLALARIRGRVVQIKAIEKRFHPILTAFSGNAPPAHLQS